MKLQNVNYIPHSFVFLDGNLKWHGYPTGVDVIIKRLSKIIINEWKYLYINQLFKLKYHSIIDFW